jgi:hypothetical protein
MVAEEVFLALTIFLFWILKNALFQEYISQPRFKLGKDLELRGR